MIKLTWNYLCTKRFYCTPSSWSESSIHIVLRCTSLNQQIRQWVEYAIWNQLVLAGTNKPNASHLLELVATAIVMFLLIYCSAHCLPKYHNDWLAVRVWNILMHFDSHYKTPGQLLMTAVLKAEVSNFACAICQVMYSPTSLDIYNRINFLGDFRHSIFHPPQQKTNAERGAFFT